MFGIEWILRIVDAVAAFCGLKVSEVYVSCIDASSGRLKHARFLRLVRLIEDPQPKPVTEELVVPTPEPRVLDGKFRALRLDRFGEDCWQDGYRGRIVVTAKAFLRDDEAIQLLAGQQARQLSFLATETGEPVP